MRTVCFLSLLFAIASCSNERPAKQDAPAFTSSAQTFVHTAAERIITTTLSGKPNWQNNNNTVDEAEAAIFRAFKPELSKGLYNDLPMKLSRVEQYQEDGKAGYVALFEIADDQFPSNRLASKMRASVFGLLDKAAIDTLKDDKAYYIDGKLLSVKTDNVTLLTNLSDEIEKIYMPDIRIKVSSIQRAD